MLKNDTKKLWKLLDWKGCPKTRPEEIPPDVIYQFFQNIFQSKVLDNKPKLEDIKAEIMEYNLVSEVTDNDIDMNELEMAIKMLGTGSSFDGIAPDIISSIPNSLLCCILKLFQAIFDGCYPSQWKSQLLMPFPKKDHSRSDPKLRGIAIGPILSRVYDIIINNRFTQWYHPNPEQAGFRKGQGCILQIFSLILLLDMAKLVKKELFIGLIDYEKAFDYVNRAELVRSMMKNRIGSRFLRNFVNVYRDTKYITKISNSYMGPEINTDFGVTQGKNSSSSIFSFFISDMHDDITELNTTDFMDPMNLLELADDTSVLADNVTSFKLKMTCTLDYSDVKHQKVNTVKTKYLHMSNTPLLSAIHLKTNTFIDSVCPKDGYSWLGLWITPTADIEKLLIFNLKKKVNATCKFYAWLEMNQETPFQFKMKVLYGCMFATLLYSCEAWGNIDCIGEKLILIEKKALKSCLGVKKGTTDDLKYIPGN